MGSLTLFPPSAAFRHTSTWTWGGDSPKWIETMLLSVLYGWNLNQTNYSLRRHHLVLIVWGKSYRVWVYHAQQACTLKQSELASSSGLQIKLCENYTHLRNTCISVFREKDKQTGCVMDGIEQAVEMETNRQSLHVGCVFITDLETNLSTHAHTHTHTHTQHA